MPIVIAQYISAPSSAAVVESWMTVCKNEVQATGPRVMKMTEPVRERPEKCMPKSASQ